MLARLEDALGRTNLAKQMVLQGTASPHPRAQTINLVVGYDGSPRSQTALDLTLWIAHQTRLATSKQVTVQVVYVVNSVADSSSQTPDYWGRQEENDRPRPELRPDRCLEESLCSVGMAQSSVALAQPADRLAHPLSRQLEQFEQADRILWQARHLADEWRGSLKTHLRFGQVATELRDVVQAETASLLVLGCESAESPLVQELGNPFPCPILGIPSAMERED